MNWKFSSNVVEVKKVILDYFHGVVFQDPIIVALELSRVRVIKVSFEPKA